MRLLNKKQYRTMDKKKVEELLKDADICFLGYERNGCRDLVLMGLRRLHEAQDELDKSDWVSVEDGLPEYNEPVLVCNKKYPNFVKESFRVESTDVPRSRRKNLDANGFINYMPNHGVTHWKPIEKLED